MRRSISTVLAAIGVLVSTMPASPAAAQSVAAVATEAVPTIDAIDVEGTEFVVRLADGRSLRSRDLVGAVLNVRFTGKAMRFRIAAVEQDPTDATGTVWLHTLEVPADDGSWRNYCNPGLDGRRQGFPLAGGKNGPELACTSGNIAKCVRFGYRRWTTNAEGESLAPVHAACLNMLAGNYGGDRPWTKKGMYIHFHDALGVHGPDAEPPVTFEAGWSPEGAVCVHHVRVKENVTLVELEARYPRLRGRTGDVCTEQFAREHGAVLFNRSRL